MTPYILLFVGLVLIFIEFFLPGGILAVIGGVSILAAMVLFVFQTNSALAALLFIVGALVLLALLIKFSLWRLKRGHLGKSIFLNTHQEGFTASSFDQTLIGKEGKALCDLKPAGHILVEGKRFQALSKTGYITKDSQVIVTGGQGAHLIVKNKEN